jgi:hypothetical protein
LPVVFRLRFAHFARLEQGRAEIARRFRPGDASHLRGKPQQFTIVSNQTVRVDMDIDTGIR